MSYDDIICAECQDKYISYETKKCECGYIADERDFLIINMNHLEQHAFSVTAEERTAMSIGNGELERTDSIPNSTKKIEGYEILNESLEYFLNNKELKKDFKDRFCEEIGEEYFDAYIDVVTNYWYDGNSRRNDSKKIKRFKHSIFNYLTSKYDNFYCLADEPKNVESMFESQTIEKILEINEGMLSYAIPNWINRHPKRDFFGTNEIYFKRGINYDFQDTESIYYEKDFINSYSLSLTVAEQFSQLGESTRSLISGEMALFQNRVLFFSPFIEGVQKQIEIGIIPHYNEIKCIFSAEMADVEEFILK